MSKELSVETMHAYTVKTIRMAAEAIADLYSLVDRKEYKKVKKEILSHIDVISRHIQELINQYNIVYTCSYPEEIDERMKLLYAIKARAFIGTIGDIIDQLERYSSSMRLLCEKD